MFRIRAIAPAAAFALALAGCATIHNEPVNRPLSGAARHTIDLGRDVATYSDDLLIGLAFSGGGTRAAAFAFGVLQELDETRTGQGTLLDRVDFVSGVSGGSVLAAYYGLKRRSALADFRERFLLRDAEESLSGLNPNSVARAFAGGINDASQFPRWLDRNLFEGATFAQMRHDRRPRVWINAADIYNRTTFVFGRTAFTAICSDLDAYPVAQAVAASAAVPVVFAPIVIESYPGDCAARLPAWIERARANPSAPPMLKTFADAMGRYRDGSMRYIKLLDGGLVDNYGLSGFTIARLSSDTPYGPLTPEQAVKLRRALFVVVDAGRGPSGDWTRTVAGPSGTELVMAAADTAIDASVRASFTAFDSTTAEWQGALIRWRCGLSAEQRRRYGAPANWNCRDLKFTVNRVAFDQLGAERAAELNAVPTRFKLPPEQVDHLIAAGRDALRANKAYRDFLGSLGRSAPARRPVPPRPQPVAGMPVAAVAAEPR
ncbi:MAG: patatin-like phospholipase family protein [Alphaproteobacteria bacterium]|nr:patatin-like phospholipase family protein [Alphaproteobacteria bacterium]